MFLGVWDVFWVFGMLFLWDDFGRLGCFFGGPGLGCFWVFGMCFFCGILEFLGWFLCGVGIFGGLGFERPAQRQR